MTDHALSETEILAIERPEPRLLTYYIIASLAWGPAAPIGLILRYFRYRTLRYRFSREGISMSWGIMFRREVHLTYARIQDIHLTSNVVQRWLGLARIDIQTASGKAKAEMTIEGIGASRELRDFLYDKMRGARVGGQTLAARTGAVSGQHLADDPELASVLLEIAAELRALRRELQGQGSRQDAADV